MNDTKPLAIIGGVLVLIVAGGAWWMTRRPAPEAANASPAAVTATEAPIEKPAEPPVALPPLAEMDAFLRPLVSALSDRPELVRWLATDDLVRQLAAAIDQAAKGGSPARDLKVIAPAGAFTTSGSGARRTIAPASYRRYDGLAATITSIDAASAAKIYRTIQPRLNEAYRAMGNPNGEVDRALHQALELLLATPVPEGPIALVEGDGASWAYADARLEALRPAQKQVLRMGPAHARAVLQWLAAFRAEL